MAKRLHLSSQKGVHIDPNSGVHRLSSFGFCARIAWTTDADFSCHCWRMLGFRIGITQVQQSKAEIQNPNGICLEGLCSHKGHGVALPSNALLKALDFETAICTLKRGQAVASAWFSDVSQGRSWRSGNRWAFDCPERVCKGMMCWPTI